MLNIYFKHIKKKIVNLDKIHYILNNNNINSNSLENNESKWRALHYACNIYNNQSSFRVCII